STVKPSRSLLRLIPLIRCHHPRDSIHVREARGHRRVPPFEASGGLRRLSNTCALLAIAAPGEPMDQQHGEFGFLALGLVLLVAAVLSVPIARRIGLPAIVAYLVAGVIIGPYG